MLSDQELLNLKRGGESEQVEMKPSTTQGDSIRRAVCAFANDLLGQGNGGVVLIGLHNDGSCAGIEDVDRAQRLLTDWVHSGMILPLPDVEIYCRELEGSPVIVVEVRAHANPPLRYKGQVWVRVGTTNHRSTPEQERRLVERRRGGDRPFDGRPIRGTSMADLDLAYFEREYLPNAVAPQVLEDNQRTMDEQLRALRLLTDGVPNNGGML
ncbi:MAG: putative DNA binding domain-containing protein [Nitrococcus sp.]|nr:putative DNA binding domain-containing protein [Nitrococcus sp.]